MHALIIEIISRVSYLVLCYVFLSTMAYFTYGWQWEYAFALVSKANQSSDYNFSESIVWETSFQTLTHSCFWEVPSLRRISPFPLLGEGRGESKGMGDLSDLEDPTQPVCMTENDNIQKTLFALNTPPMQISFPAHSTRNGLLACDLQADVTKVKPITHSSFCWNALWLTHVAYFFPMECRFGFTFAIYALLLLAKACMHLQSFLSPGQMHGFFSVTVYWWCLLALYVGFTDGWLFSTSAIAEFAIEPIDCELKPH